MTSEEDTRLRKAIKHFVAERENPGNYYDNDWHKGMDILYSLLRSDRYRVPAEEVPPR